MNTAEPQRKREWPLKDFLKKNVREAASPAGAGYQRHVGVNADMRRVAPEANGMTA